MKLAILTSGGDSPGMNAAVRAAVRTAAVEDIEIIAFEDGYRGLLEDRTQRLGPRSVSDILDRGGTFIGSGRSEEFTTPEGLAKAAGVLKEHQVDGLIVIGGDGSMRGAHELVQRGIAYVGAPATIDNDLGGTDYCIGFDTALNTIIYDVSKIRDTASAMDRVFVVEVMGRESGMLALHAGLACGADAVVIPEIEFDYQEMFDRIRDASGRHKMHYVILVAEGACSVHEVAKRTTEETAEEVRVSVLGYIQRGGSPSALDRTLACRFGARAVELLAAGENDLMVGVLGEDLVTVPIAEAAATKHDIDRSMYELIGRLAR